MLLLMETLTLTMIPGSPKIQTQLPGILVNALTATQTRVKLVQSLNTF